MLLTYWQRETEASLKQCSLSKTLPHSFEEVVTVFFFFSSFERKSRAERMDDHRDAEQVKDNAPDTQGEPRGGSCM